MFLHKKSLSLRFTFPSLNPNHETWTIQEKQTPFKDLYAPYKNEEPCVYKTYFSNIAL